MEFLTTNQENNPKKGVRIKIVKRAKSPFFSFLISSMTLLIVGFCYYTSYSVRQSIELIEKRIDSLTVKSNKADIQVSLIGNNNKIIKPLNNTALPTQLIDSNSQQFALSGQFNFFFDLNISDTDMIFISGGGTHVKNYRPTLNNQSRGILYVLGVDFQPISIEGNRIILNLNVYDLKQNLIVEIKNNKWLKNPNYDGIINYDNKGVEVLDSLRNIAFSMNIRYKSILIQGYFVDLKQNKVFIWGKRRNISILPGSPEKRVVFASIASNQSKLFDYSSPHWLGKRLPFTYSDDSLSQLTGPYLQMR